MCTCCVVITLLVLCPVSDMSQCIHMYMVDNYIYVSSYTYVLYLNISMYMHTCTLIYICVVQIKGILKNRTQIEEWIEDKAIRRRWRHSRHQDGSDSEEEEEESSSDEVGQEKASKKNKKTHSKPFVYPYDLGWRRNLSQVSGGELNALYTPGMVCM